MHHGATVSAVVVLVVVTCWGACPVIKEAVVELHSLITNPFPEVRGDLIAPYLLLL